MAFLDETGLAHLWEKIKAYINSSFQAGCSKIATALTNQGVTTASNASPDTIATNIATLAENKYQSGVAAGASLPNADGCLEQAMTNASAALGSHTVIYTPSQKTTALVIAGTSYSGSGISISTEGTEILKYEYGGYASGTRIRIYDLEGGQPITYSATSTGATRSDAVIKLYCINKSSSAFSGYNIKFDNPSRVDAVYVGQNNDNVYKTYTATGSENHIFVGTWYDSGVGASVSSFCSTTGTELWTSGTFRVSTILLLTKIIHLESGQTMTYGVSANDSYTAGSLLLYKLN